MGKIQRGKTMKSEWKRKEEMIKEIRRMNDKRRILNFGNFMGRIQSKTIMKSMNNRKKATVKKYRTSEVGSQSMETVMLATEQRQEMVMLARSQSMETVMQSTEQPQEDMVMLVRSQSMERVMLATEQQQENYKMLLEILSRLPVKSLLRFMCTNKQWKTVISSHPFRKMHREEHTSSPPLPIAYYNTRDSPLERKILIMKTHLLTFDRERRFVEKVTVPIPCTQFHMQTPPYQSKLLCFLSYDLMISYLYNPSTRQSFLLTNPSSFSSPKNLDLRSSAYGYIPSKDEYMMVHLLKSSNGKPYCEVLGNISISNDNFKLRYKNQWRSSTEATMMLESQIGPVVFVGGAFYWQSFGDPQNPKEDGFILSFNVEADSFSTINFPPGVLRSYDARPLEIKNELYLVVYPERHEILVMWKWSSENKLWSQDWKFDFEKLFGFIRGGAPHHERRDCFRSELFIYTLKYLKGYEDQPSDDEVSAEMGDLHLPDGVVKIPIWAGVDVHSNLFTL